MLYRIIRSYVSTDAPAPNCNGAFIIIMVSMDRKLPNLFHKPLFRATLIMPNISSVPLLSLSHFDVPYCNMNIEPYWVNLLWWCMLKMGTNPCHQSIPWLVHAGSRYANELGGWSSVATDLVKEWLAQR